MGRFRLLGVLGRGGMGTVYRARDEELGRDVALKLRHAGAWSAEEEERFRREAQATARLDHPGIVRLLEVGSSEGRAFLVLELVEGETLAVRLQAGLELRTALIAAAEVADALAGVHAAGLVHRDVKPSNILLRRDTGRAALTDFGLVYDPKVSRLTRSGGLVGTVAYMAPEQGDGEAGPPADVYSLGAVLYEAVAGRPPFVGDSVLDLLKRIATEEPPALHSLVPAVDARLAALVHRCLRRQPSKRPGAARLARSLRELLGLAPPRARLRPGAVALGVGLVVCALVGLGHLPGGPAPTGGEREAPAAPAVAPVGSDAGPAALEVSGGEYRRDALGPTPFETRSWGPADPNLRGLNVVRREELGIRDSSWAEFRRKGSLLELSFQLQARPAWGRLLFHSRALRVKGELHSPLRIVLNGQVLSEGRTYTKGSSLDLSAALQAGDNRLVIQLQEQARARWMLRTVTVASGQGALPPAGENFSWYAEAQTPSLAVVEERQVGRAGRGRLVLEAPGPSEVVFACAPARPARWVKLASYFDYPSRRDARVDLRLDGRLLRSGWNGGTLVLPGSLMRPGSHRLSLSLPEGAPLPVWLRTVQVMRGDGPLRVGQDRVVTELEPEAR